MKGEAEAIAEQLASLAYAWEEMAKHNPGTPLADAFQHGADELREALPAAPPQESGPVREPAGWMSRCSDEDCDADPIYTHRPPDTAVECECGRVLEWDALDRRAAPGPQESGQEDADAALAVLVDIAGVLDQIADSITDSDLRREQRRASEALRIQRTVIASRLAQPAEEREEVEDG